MAGDTSIDMMINVLPGTLTGFFALNAGLSSINQQFQNMTKAVDNHFGIVDATIVSAATLLSQFSKNAADAFGEYEQGMKIVQVVSGQSSASIEELGKKANEFSVQYRMDIGELTEGLQTLGRAGLKTASEQTEVLENGLQTAKLEGRDLNTVLEELLQNTTLLGGDLKSSNFGEQSQYVNDLLVATSMTAPINTHDVSETLKYSGGIAAAAGANIESPENKAILEDYMASIAAFAQKGVKGSIAGTALRAFFNKPATQDSSVVEGLSMVGLKPEYLWEDDESKMKPISEQIGLIQSQMDKKGISQMDRLQIWSKIVGGKMGQQMMKLDSKDIKEITKDIREANSAEKMATQSMQSYQSAMKQTGEAGQQAFRAYGEHVARFLKPVAQMLTPILQAMAHPVISTGVFISFIALLGRAWNSIGKIFSGVRLELGLVKGLMNSTILSQPNREAIMGGRRWGDPQGVMDYEKQKTIVKEISSVVKESSASTKADISLIYEKLEHIRRNLSAATNKAKEEIIKIRQLLSSGASELGKQLATAFTSSASKAKIEFTSTSDEVLTSSKVKFDRNIQSSAAKMKVELQAALNSLTYTPKIKSTSAATSASMVKGMTDTNSPSYMFLQQSKRKLQDAENEFQRKMTSLEKSRANVMITRNLESEKGKTDKKIAQLTGHRDSLQKQLDNTNKQIEGYNNTILSKRNKLIGTKDPDHRKNLSNEIKEAEEQRALLMEKKRLINQELAYKKEEISIYKQMLSEIKMVLAEIKTERLSLLSGKGTTTPVTDSSGKLLPGTVPVNQIPPEYLPNYKTTPVSSSVTYGRYNLPKEYAPNYKKSDKDYVNERKEEKANIDKKRAENEKVARAEAKARNASLINAKKLEEYNTRMSDGMKNIGTGAMMSRMFGGDYNYAQMKREAYRNLGVSAKIDGVDENKLIPFFEQLELAIKQNTLALEQNTTASVAGLGAYKNTFNEKSLAQREAQYQDKLRRTQVFGYENNHFDPRTREFKSGYSGYIHGGTEALDAHKNFQKEVAQVTKRETDALAYMMGENVKNYEKTIDEARKTTPLAKRNSLSGQIGVRWGAFKRQNDIVDTTGFKNKISSVGKGLKGFGGVIKSATSLIGGPFFAGIMAADIAMQLYNSAQQAYTKKIEEATNKLDDMIQKQGEAEDIFFNGKHEEGEVEYTGWSEENPDATAEEKEDALLGAYANIYDNAGSNLDAINDNTQQLAIATEEVKRAGDKLGKEYLDNSFFSGNGPLANFFHGHYRASDYVNTIDNPDLLGLIGADSKEKKGVLTTDKAGLVSYGNEASGSYFENDEVKVDKSWQEGEDYPWLKEFSPLIAADIWKTGTTKDGLQVALGATGYKALSDQLSSTGGWDNSAWTRHGYNIANSFKTDQDQNRLQLGLKNYQKDFSKTAKQMRRYEKATGVTPLRALNKQFGKTKDMKKALKNLAVQDPKLVNYIKSLAIKTGMNEQQVLMAAQLQQLQDMNEIANNQVSPQLMSLVSTAYQQVAYGGQTLSTVSGSGDGAISAAQNAAAIAALLQVKVEAELAQQQFTEYTEKLGGEEGKYKTPEQLRAAAIKAHNDELHGNLDENRRYLLGYYDNYMKAYAGVNSKLFNPEYTPDQMAQAGEEFLKNSQGADSSTMYDTLRKGLSAGVSNQILSAYDASLDDQEGSGGGGGGGGSGGSGSGDNNKDTGTKKERVDLVLCNKKEIPKLNVNLFKKPPTFTVLNKNFKLRDVKINTEDKPKAIMSSIKNAFIDVQKRTDPKIIQDEEAEYDPAGATDGNALPSGSSKPTTN